MRVARMSKSRSPELKLPKQIHERMQSEFQYAAKQVAESSSFGGKLYYFSVFYGEPIRLLNLHWDADVSLLLHVVQAACVAMTTNASQGQTPGVPSYWA